MEKISYALGLGIGQQLKSMNIENFDIKEFSRSIEDVMAGRDTDMTAREAQVMLSEYFQKKEKEQAEENIAKGKAYLEENGKREGVVTTTSGLQYEVLTEGTGKSPKATDKVRCHYEGRLTDGSVFDSSYQRGEPADFGLNQVIAGWTEGLQLVGKGGQITLWIPAELGYGVYGSGSGAIGPNDALEFKVELHDVQSTATPESVPSAE